MNPRDPWSAFEEPDKTVIRPVPGGLRPPPPVTARGQPHAVELPEIDFPINDFSGSYSLTVFAYPLLSIVPKLRVLPFHQAIHDLQERLVIKIKSFEEGVSRQGVSQKQVKIASYFLCSFLDDMVLNTPWGSQSNWAQNSLSIQLHHRNVGGEEFFQILQQLMQQPAQNLDLLELAYLCLSLGFEGQYRNQDRGIRALDDLRQELYLVLQRMKGDVERDLSIQWQGVCNLHSPVTRDVPLWVHAAIAVLLLTLGYLGFSYTINSASDRVYNQIFALPREKIVLPPLKLVTVKPAQIEPPKPEQIEPPRPLFPQPPRPTVDRLQTLLASEIAQNMVMVLDGPMLRIVNAFPSGSDQMRKDFRPMLAKIAQELANDTSRIVVIGHTDNQPMRFSARFKSNWELSVARAERVASVLETSAVFADRIRFEGHADREPIAPNDVEKNQALNRRIDIHLR
jgi:type VI secretion system protein ImpK